MHFFLQDVDINPKTMPTEELYGHISLATREWKDGLLSAVMRDLGAIPNEAPKWIVLDGDLDANWIESMNSVMDDNRVRISAIETCSCKKNTSSTTTLHCGWPSILRCNALVAFARVCSITQLPTPHYVANYGYARRQRFGRWARIGLVKLFVLQPRERRTPTRAQPSI